MRLFFVIIPYLTEIIILKKCCQKPGIRENCEKVEVVISGVIYRRGGKSKPSAHYVSGFIDNIFMIKVLR